MNRSTAAVCTLAITATGLAVAGPDWTEVGDAGSLLESAQTPLGIGQISSIAGSLGGRGEGGDFEDMYIIAVDEPSSFRIELLKPSFDAQLFVFNITLAGGALGLLANDAEAPDFQDPP